MIVPRFAALILASLAAVACSRRIPPAPSNVGDAASDRVALAATDASADAEAPLIDGEPEPDVPREGPWISDVSLLFEQSDASVRAPRVYSLIEGRWIPVQREGDALRVRAAYDDTLLVIDGALSGLTRVSAVREALRASVRLATPWTFRGQVREWVQNSESHAGAPIEGAYIVVRSPFGEGHRSPPAGVFVRPRREPPPFASGWLRYCGGRVTTEPLVASSVPVRSDREGRFALPLRARSYLSFVCAPGYAPQSFSWMGNVQLHDPPEPLDVRLVRSVPIRGRVVDERDQPLAGVLVETDVFMGMPDGIITPLDAAFTAADGTFSLEAPAGERRIVRVAVAGRRPVRVEDVLAGTHDLVLRAPSFALTAAIRPIVGAVFHREGGSAENLVLEANGTFRAEASACSSASVVEGRFVAGSAGATLAPSRATHWRVRSVGQSADREYGANRWLHGEARTRMQLTLSADGSLTLRSQREGRAVVERYLRGAECVACSESGLMAGRVVRTEACEGHPVQQYGNGFPAVLER